MSYTKNTWATGDIITADKLNNIESGIAALAVGGVYQTLAHLIAANPDHNRTYITTDNGNWNYWNGTTWVAGGVYQSVGIDVDTITPYQLKTNTSVGMLFPSGDKPFNFDTASRSLYIPPVNVMIKGAFQVSAPEQTLSLIDSTGRNHYIIFDTDEKTFRLGNTGAVPINHVLVGGLRDNNYYLNGPFTVDNKQPALYDRQPFYSIYAGGSGLTINTDDKTITSNIMYFNMGNYSFKINDTTFTYTGNSVLYAYINLDTKEMEYQAPGINTTPNRVFLGWINPGTKAYSLIMSDTHIKFVPQNQTSGDILNTLQPIIGLGDSITAGYVPGGSNNGGWPSILQTNLKINMINYGVNSATIQNGSENDTISFVNRAKEINFSEANNIVIFGGTNDFAQNLPIGSLTDTTDRTMLGALNLIINSIYASNKVAKIFVVSPMWRARITGAAVDIDKTKNDIDLYLTDYLNAQKELATLYHIPFIDLYHSYGTNLKNYNNWLSDGLHPNTNGYSHLARLIGNFVKNNQ